MQNLAALQPHYASPPDPRNPRVFGGLVSCARWIGERQFLKSATGFRRGQDFTFPGVSPWLNMNCTQKKHETLPPP